MKTYNVNYINNMKKKGRRTYPHIQKQTHFSPKDNRIESTLIKWG